MVQTIEILSENGLNSNKNFDKEAHTEPELIKTNGNSVHLYFSVLFSCIGGFLFG